MTNNMSVFSFINSQILFYLSVIVILFIPGYFLLLAVFGKNEDKISKLERFIFSFGLSLIIVNFIAFTYSKLNIPITALSSVLGVLFFSLACFGIYLYCHSRAGGNDKDKLFSFSKKQFVLIFLLLFLTIFIKTAYLSGTVAPTSTDMGHHMYWVKLITETHKLPDYEGMPDFIIGEHIAISEIAMISQLDVFSALPVIFLLIINLLSILVVFVFTLRIFKNKNIAILTLLFLGVLFAISSPQAKFVSGGVMGNILGNLLMPMAFYFYFRAIESLFTNPPLPLGEDVAYSRQERDFANSKKFLSLGILSTFGLFYTHHLTAFIFLFVFSLAIFIFLAINYKDLVVILRKFSKIIFSFPVIMTFLAGLIFFFFIFTPTYISTSAVGTAVGAPSKATREGLSINNLKSSVGEARLALGAIGFILLIIGYRKKNFGFALASSWTAMIFLMSTKPDLIFINLPSSRIGNYLSYPLAILSSYAFYKIFHPDFSNLKKLGFKDDIKNPVFNSLFFGAFLLIGVFALSEGFLDSAQAVKKSPDFTPLVKTFDASEYLKKNINKEDVVLKDHNYIIGDSWIKLFFMQNYRYPLSRGYFKRYEDPTKPREMCTLHMISNPSGNEAVDCFSETKTNFLMINPLYDSSQFKKLKDFDAIYNNGGVAIYHRK